MKGYSFGELVKLAEAAMPKAGGTFTGNITAPAVFISGAQSTDSKAATRYDWVAAELRKKLDLAGGTLTGTLTGTKFLQTGAQGTEGNSLARRDYVDTKVARYEYGIGVKQGISNDAAEYTEDKTSDFNKLLTAGEFTVSGSWENGINGKATAESHTGIVKVEVRQFGAGPSYVQTFKWAAGQAVGAKTRVGSGTYPNITWKRWIPNGTYEQEVEYRLQVIRPGASSYPYMTMLKQDWREDVADNGVYTAGLIQYRMGPSAGQDPDTDTLIGSVQAQVAGSNDYSTMLITSRNLQSSSNGAELRVGVVDNATKQVGVSFKSGGKTTSVSAGVLSTDKVLVSTAQGTESNSLTRKDYVDGLVKKYLPLTGGELAGQLVVSNDDITVVVRPKTAGRASYIRGQDSAGVNQWIVGDSDGSGVLSLQAKNSYLNIGTDGVKIGGGASITGSWYKAITSDRYSGLQGLTTGNVERYAVFHDSTTGLLNLRSQGGHAIEINSSGDLTAYNDLFCRAFGAQPDGSGYRSVAVQAPVAGSYSGWVERQPALQVSCPHAESSAYSIWKATQWNRAHIAAMDVHMPASQIPQVVLHMSGSHSNHVWAGNDYTAVGSISAGNGVFDRGHLVYSPHNVPNLAASQGNYDVVAGNPANVGAYMFMQNHPSLAFGSRTPGEVAPGSHLRPCECDNDWDDWVDWYIPPGNWRCQGFSNFGGPVAGGTEGDFAAGKTLWIRCN